MQRLETDVVIIGAGPTGLTAAYKLSQAGLKSIVLEKAPLVGGIARTEEYKGYRIDIGGHRFYTKVEAVDRIWHEVLEQDFLRRPRLSRIYYNQKFFHYPIQLFDTLSQLGPVESLRIGMSYLMAKVFPYPEEDNFEQWVSNRFGRRLFQIFFKSYTEKVWGIPCHEIKAEWAAQRIKNLSLSVALRNAIFRNGHSGESVTTLINAFDYPRLGPGMLWEKVQDLVEAEGHQVRLAHEVVQLVCIGDRLDYVVARTPEGSEIQVKGKHVISSIPLPELVRKFKPEAPASLLAAAGELTFRDFLTVALIVNQADVFPDNWIYVHSPDVLVGRIQNFRNWSPDMVPNEHTTCLGLEYFCQETDALWQMDDADLIELGRREVVKLGLVDNNMVIDGVVFRQPKAYPVYTGAYQAYLNQIKSFIGRISNLQTAGRNGLHRYNNQDHSMLTAIFAVENILGADHDLWAVNTERSYYEEVRLPKHKTN